jgi:multimeric flavodoxin WrbA
MEGAGMSKKIMIVCGSPNKRGNTNRVVEWVAGAAQEAGADVEIIDAAHLDYKTNGCIACMGCQKSDEYRCVIDDDATPIIARMPEADAVVLASPVYWHGPTAQFKLLGDRMFSLVKFATHPFTTALEGTTLAVIGTAAGPPEGGLELMEQVFRLAAENLSLPFESLLVPEAPRDPEELEGNAEIREKAAALGRKLAGA